MERDIVWIQLEGKLRPGVVMEAEPDRVRVAYGTSQEHIDWPQIVVSHDSRQGRAFPLRETTHFYGANTVWELRDDVTRTKTQCSWELFYSLRDLILGWDKSR
jgi:hypothetical protein